MFVAPSILAMHPATDLEASSLDVSISVANLISSLSRAPPPPSGVAFASASAAVWAFSTPAWADLTCSTSISAAARRVSNSACSDFAVISSRAGFALSRTFVAAFSDPALAAWLLFSSEAQFDIVASVLPFSFMCFPSMNSKHAFTAVAAERLTTSKSSATFSSSSHCFGSSIFCASASAIWTSSSATSMSFRNSSWRLCAAWSASSFSRLRSSSCCRLSSSNFWRACSFSSWRRLSSSCCFWAASFC
mmetsp:Transcript_62855/g.87373  ORF Transcript_62855/g.87373 Transcript_62855/m.87373 type:complete len:248 (+) Transcript_62855:340-1083(+)